jgi:pyridoxamine 5'-phosphate oxidase
MSLFPLADLREADVPADPLVLFTEWFEAAVAADLTEPAAMTLATATPDGWPSARIVLLRGYDERGFVFFTNYQSRKGAELAANPRAALAIYWAPLHRQVRIEGSVAVVSAAESDAYFQSRPLGHRLGALASPQSQVIPDRHFLEARLTAVEQQCASGVVPRPAHWGGYRVVPATIEFWQARENRLHDRLRYRRDAQYGWILERLAP